MFINLETNHSKKEIDTILSYKTCCKYPYRLEFVYDSGINWVCNKRRFLCLFYEDGTMDSRGYQSNIRPFFYGTIIKIKNKYRIIGITCVEVSYIILIIVSYLIIAFFSEDTLVSRILGIIFFAIMVYVSNMGISQGTEKIKKYLERQFFKG